MSIPLAMWKRSNHIRRCRVGFGLIEIILVLAIMGITLISLTQLGQFALRLSAFATDRVEVATILREGAEAMRYLRADGWSRNIAPLITGIKYYLVFDGVKYNLTTVEPAFIDGRFSRRITLADVARDTNDSIVASGGTNDPGTKQVAVQVAWSSGVSTSTESVVLYLTNRFQN